MRDFVIITDSCCDLAAETARELELEVLPLSFHLKGQDYYNYLDGHEISFPDFYAQVRGGEQVTTAAVNVGQFESAMRAALEAGRDVLSISFSSALSTTYQSSVIAAEGLREEFPDAKILTVDSLGASMGQGLLLWLCVQQKRAGRSLEEVHAYAEDMKLRIIHWFTVDDLNHLKRGGRVSAAAALFGTMLSVKPVLHVDNEGRLIPVHKVRGRRASLLALVDEMEKSMLPAAEQTVFISHGDCEADARFVAEEIRRRFGIDRISINFVGPVIGSHAGPGTIALFYLGSGR